METVRNQFKETFMVTLKMNGFSMCSLLRNQVPNSNTQSDGKQHMIHVSSEHGFTSHAYYQECSLIERIAILLKITGLFGNVLTRYF